MFSLFTVGLVRDRVRMYPVRMYACLDHNMSLKGINMDMFFWPKRAKVRMMGERKSRARMTWGGLGAG